MINLGKVFFDSFFFAFRLSENPLKKMLEDRRKTKDIERIKQDWENTGNDIREAYEYETGCETF